MPRRKSMIIEKPRKQRQRKRKMRRRRRGKKRTIARRSMTRNFPTVEWSEKAKTDQSQ